MARPKTSLNFVYAPATKSLYLGHTDADVSEKKTVSGTISFQSVRDQLGFILELKDVLNIKLSSAIDANSLLGAG